MSGLRVEGMTFKIDDDFAPMTEEQVTRLFGALDDESLAMASIVQQGAINAISYLMKHGCTFEVASHMLESQRLSARIVRAEMTRRGLPPFFEIDQDGIN